MSELERIKKETERRQLTARLSEVKLRYEFAEEMRREMSRKAAHYIKLRSQWERKCDERLRKVCEIEDQILELKGE